MQKFKPASITLIAFIAVSSAQATSYSLSGGMDVFQATTNPSDVGNGTGTISGSYDDVANLLDYTITFSDLTSSVTNMHFHLGSPGNTGGVVVGIPGPYGSGSVSGSGISLTEPQEFDLLGGDWYVNVHTSNFSGGEIRGQVDATAVPEPSAFAAILGLLGLGLVLRRRR